MLAAFFVSTRPHFVSRQYVTLASWQLLFTYAALRNFAVLLAVVIFPRPVPSHINVDKVPLRVLRRGRIKVHARRTIAESPLTVRESGRLVSRSPYVTGLQYCSNLSYNLQLDDDISIHDIPYLQFDTSKSFWPHTSPIKRFLISSQISLQQRPCIRAIMSKSVNQSVREVLSGL